MPVLFLCSILTMRQNAQQKCPGDIISRNRKSGHESSFSSGRDCNGRTHLSQGMQPRHEPLCNNGNSEPHISDPRPIHTTGQPPCANHNTRSLKGSGYLTLALLPVRVVSIALFGLRTADLTRSRLPLYLFLLVGKCKCSKSGKLHRPVRGT